ncbi:MAG: PKD domain-containing protein, partial [Bacteroidetes bacterium]|nr:PKD domain-containing protein [Bacteroidota bacterium]
YLTESITATGCSKSDSVTITVNPLPSAKAGSSTAICNGGSTTIGATAVSGNTYSWTSNPIGFTSTNANPTVSPTATTVYYLTESITATGCSKSDSVTITVNPLPSAKFSASIECHGLATKFTDSSSTPKRIWYFGDGDTSTVFNPIHKYKTAGSFIASMVVTNGASCIDSSSKTVIVNALPNAAWTAIETSNHNYSFAAKDTTLTSYLWDFGDGNTGNGFKTSHAYSKDSTFIVKLSVTNSNGCNNEIDSVFAVVTSIALEGFNNNVHLNIYPNPFEHATNINYTLKTKANVNVVLMDITGKQIAVIANSNQSSGTYNFLIDAEKYNLRGGVYFIRMMVDGAVISRQIIKLK